MKNDVGSTRWARELNERDVRLMREKGPGYIHHVTPPPELWEWRRAAAWALIVAVLFGVGIALGSLAHWVFG